MARIKLTKRALRDVLTTGVEGGINYWANDYAGNAVEYSGTPKDLDNYGVASLTISKPIEGTDAEGVEPMNATITGADIRRAMQWLLDAANDDTTPSHAKVSHESAAAILGQFKPDGFYGDAHDADVLVQVAVFGRVIYG